MVVTSLLILLLLLPLLLLLLPVLLLLLMVLRMCKSLVEVWTDTSWLIVFLWFPTTSLVFVGGVKQSSHWVRVGML